MEFLSKNTAETAKIASNFAEATLNKADFANKKATIIGLYGELGSGKTIFMKYLAKSFGIEDTIQSPTFVIEKIYELKNRNFRHLIHVDAYRIEKGEEMVNLGWNEIISDPENLVCVEWAEKISGIMPPHIKVFFEHVSETERKIKIEQ